MAWLGYRLKDGPTQRTENASGYTATVRGTRRRPHLSVYYLRNPSTSMYVVGMSDYVGMN